MIKIIEKGKETFELTCARCGCRFSYEAEDITETLIGALAVKCPQCAAHNIHPR